MPRHYQVYIFTNKPHGTLYIGMTNNIGRRFFEHKFNPAHSFTHKYAVNKIVYLEHFTDVGLAIKREQQLKNWHRAWKIKLIQQANPLWKDLSNEIF